MSETSTTPEAGKSSPRRKIWITVAAAAVVAAIGIPAGAFAYSGYQTQQTTAAATSAFQAAQKAHDAAAASATKTPVQAGAAKQLLDTVYVPTGALVQSHPTLFSPEAAKALKADADAFTALLKNGYLADKDKTKPGTWQLQKPVDVPLTLKQAIAKYLESDQARAKAAQALKDSGAENAAAVERNALVVKDLDDVRVAFEKDLKAAAASAPKLKDPYVATVPKGSADAQAVLTKTLTGLQPVEKGTFTPDAKTTLLTVFKAYTDAADALKASNDQVVATEQAAAQRAAEEAARQAAGDGGSSGDGGGSSDGGSSDGGSGGWNGGGGSSGGGGSTGGGGGGGGSTGGGGSGGGTSDPGPRGTILATGEGCGPGSGSGGVVGPNNWSSNIVVPAKASSYWPIDGEYGVNWYAGYRCADF